VESETRHCRHHCSVCDAGKDFDKNFVFEGVHNRQVDRRIRNFLRKAGLITALISCSKSCGAQAQLRGGQAAADRAVPTPKKTLSFFFRSFRSLPLTLFCRLSGVGYKGPRTPFRFACKENKVSGILRELLKQRLSVLHASSAVRVCQLLCTAPLETLQMQVFKNNLGQRRPMNTRLP